MIPVIKIEPEKGERWVHRSGGRVCVVVDVVDRHRVVDGVIVDMRAVLYHYEQTAGIPPGRVRRAQGTPSQEMALVEWESIFTKRAPSSRHSRRGS